MSVTSPGILTRARIRRPGQTWRTTGLSLSSFISERLNKITGDTEQRSYITIKDTTADTEIRLKWSEVKELHATLGDLMAKTSQMIAADDPTT